MLTVLLTGFGPFPGAPFNPTGPLVRELARHGGGGRGVRVAHVFQTSYEAVDRELPRLLDEVAPDALVMFGLAQRSRHLRIETCARNALSRRHRDAAGTLPAASVIAAEAPAMLPLPAPLVRMLMSARATRWPARLSDDAGSYLCNYLCWRASEHARTNGTPGVVSFVHVPPVRLSPLMPRARVRPPFTLAELVDAAEALVTVAVATARARR